MYFFYNILSTLKTLYYYSNTNKSNIINNNQNTVYDTENVHIDTENVHIDVENIDTENVHLDVENVHLDIENIDTKNIHVDTDTENVDTENVDNENERVGTESILVGVIEKINDKRKREIGAIFRKHKLFDGRIVCMSKTRYEKQNNGDIIMYNAGIVHAKYGVIWEGDLNMTQDMDILKNITKEVKEELYIVEEEYMFSYIWRNESFGGKQAKTIEDLIKLSSYCINYER